LIEDCPGVASAGLALGELQQVPPNRNTFPWPHGSRRAALLHFLLFGRSTELPDSPPITSSGLAPDDAIATQERDCQIKSSTNPVSRKLVGRRFYACGFVGRSALRMPIKVSRARGE
jgi:hypothetical protein